MTRKRSNPKIMSMNPIKHVDKRKHDTVVKKREFKKKPMVAFMLISIFALVLLFNFYFNYTSGVAIDQNGVTMQTKYLLSGPDPYYNMRVVRWTIQNGHYPYGQSDPLLEYPITQARGTGGGPRPPLMNMMAIVTSFAIQGLHLLSASDALGFAMQFLPCLFGALLIFPVYFLTKELLNWKAGLIAALFVALTPVHLASGHGSAFSLFDHDALVLLLFACIYLFYVRSIKSKDNVQGLLYALLSGVFIGALIMLWVESRYTYAVLMAFFAIQLLVNIIRKNNDMRLVRNTIVGWSFGYLLALPMNMTAWHGIFRTDTAFVLIVLALFLGLYSWYVKKKDLPWLLSLPLLGCIAAAGVAVIHYAPATTIFGGFSSINNMIFGSGLYGGQTSLTIAEAQTFNMSRWVMSFGPSLFLIALFTGLPFFIYKWLKTNRYDFSFVFVWFGVTMWLNTVAGRFVNDFVPTVAILSGFVIYLVIDKINYGKMIKTITDLGGGFRGIRKGVHATHIVGVLFVLFVLLMPNIYMSIDAAVPSPDLEKFGKTDSAFGLSTYKETYWNDALIWLAKQDTNISDPAHRPGFISWWDYGFQEIASGDHPTVADNYQRGVECAANFQTAATEKEAIADLCVLLLRADSINGAFSNATTATLYKYLPDYNATESTLDNTTNITTNTTVFHTPVKDIEQYVLDPLSAPTFNDKFGRFTISAMNALYHDCIRIINSSLSDEQIVELYQDLQIDTGYSVRYYGTEGYDMDIFNVFSFLADKGTFGYSSNEDQYYFLLYTDKYNETYSPDQVANMTPVQQSQQGPFEPHQYTKDAMYKTMVVRAYRGTKDAYIPGYGLKHFEASYISPYPYPGTRNPAVVISKYYPGGFINGTVTYNGQPLPGLTVAFIDKNDIPHDMVYADTGSYSVISLAGNFSLGYYLGNTRLKTLSFTGASAISEAEANREVPYHRTINATIEQANVTGHVVNADGLSLVFSNEYYNTNPQTVTLDSNGEYTFKTMPSQYTISIQSGSHVVQTEEFFAMPGDQVHNITVSKALLYGTVNENVGDMTLKLVKGNQTIQTIAYNTTIRTYDTGPIDTGNYTIGFFVNATAAKPAYTLPITISVGVREFEISTP